MVTTSVFVAPSNEDNKNSWNNKGCGIKTAVPCLLLLGGHGHDWDGHDTTNDRGLDLVDPLFFVELSVKGVKAHIDALAVMTTIPLPPSPSTTTTKAFDDAPPHNELWSILRRVTGKQEQATTMDNTALVKLQQLQSSSYVIKQEEWSCLTGEAENPGIR